MSSRASVVVAGALTLIALWTAVGSGSALQSAPAVRELKKVESFFFSEAGRRSLREGIGAEKPRRGGTIAQVATTKYQTLNNITRNLGIEEQLCRLYLFPPLLDLDPDTLELVPLVAASRPVMSEDRLSYTWKIRPGIRWHRGRSDGTPVELTTADVEFSWRMLNDPKVMDGAPRARAALGRVKAVRAVDPYTFVVETDRPFFRAELEVGLNFRLMPAHLSAQDPEAFNKDPLGRAPVGYGPYRFEEWKEGEYLSLVRNPDWFAFEKLPYWPERLRMHLVRDVNQVSILFERGDVTLASINNCEQYELLKQDPHWREIATFHEYFLQTWIFIAWNGKRPQFADARVRRALTMLYPRELVREKVYRGHAEVLTGPWAVTAREYDPSIVPLPFDPAAAAKLLDEAGWVDRDGDGLRDKDGVPFRFVLLYSSEMASVPVFQSGTAWFQEQLKLAGIEMEQRAVELAKLTQDAGDHQYDAAFLAWRSDPRDEDVYDRFHSSQADGGGNYTAYASEECDRLLEAFRSEFDERKRLVLAHSIHRRIAEDQPCTFLFHPESLVVVSTKLRNVKMHVLGARWFDWWFAE